MRLFRLLALSLIVAASALAQHDMSSQPKPVTLEPGLGVFHWHVSTRNPEASGSSIKG